MINKFQRRKVQADVILLGKLYTVYVDIEFEIELEFREWGIKDIYIYLTDIHPFDIDEEEVAVNLDEFEVIYDWTEGMGISISGLMIDFDKAKITVYATYMAVR